MRGELVKVQQTRAVALPVTDLVAMFYEGKNPKTLRNYAAALADFAAFVGCGVRGLPGVLFAGGNGAANALVLRYRADLLARTSERTGRQLSAGTVSLRLTAVRQFVKLARTTGAVAWALDVNSPKAEAYRDTRGPGLDGVRRLLAELERREVGAGGARVRRDRAMLRLMFDMGLRRFEVLGLDLAHVDLEGEGRVLVLGKKRREREPLTLSPTARAALVAWLEVRGADPGPVFVRFTKAGTPARGRRLTGDGLWHVVAGLGEAAGVTVRPHGFRHTCITAALDAGADVREVQKLSRHADLNTLLRYDDNRKDTAGKLAAMVGALV